MPCCCLLPGCPECWGDVDDVAASKADEEKPPLGGTGKSLTIQERKLVAHVDKQLEKMLRHKYLSQGENYTDLPTWKTASGKKRKRVLEDEDAQSWEGMDTPAVPITEAEVGTETMDAEGVFFTAARGVFNCLNRELRLQEALDAQRSSSLPLVEDAAVRKRSQLISCIPVDRAYCGQTGNAADKYLLQHMRPGDSDRIALADGFHCFNTAAESAWYARMTSGRLKMSSVEDGYKVLFVNTETPEEFAFQPLVVWIDACRKFRAKFRRGILPRGLDGAPPGCQNRSYFQLSDPAEVAALHRSPRPHRQLSSNGPGPTRMVVYSAAFLQQSFVQHQVRCAALQDAIAALSERPGKDNGAKQDVCKVLLTVFLDPAPYLLAWMTAGMFLRTKGYVTCAKVIQTTDTTFFPMQMTVGKTSEQRAFVALGVACCSLTREEEHERLPLCVNAGWLALQWKLLEFLQPVAWPCLWAVLPSQVRRWWPELWTLWAKLVFTGTSLHGVAFGQHPWSASQGKDMAAQVCKSMKLEQRLFNALALQYEGKVLNSGGNHIPLAIREAATAVFWLPGILFGEVPDHPFDLPFPWLYSLLQLREYVAKRITMFAWSAVDDVELGTDAAFFLFHFTGSWSLSEASAESIASVAGRLGLRDFGFSGMGNDDEFIHSRMPGRVRWWQRRRRTRQHDHLVIMAKSPQSLYFCRNFSVSFVREEKALALAQRLAEVLTTETRHSWAVAVFRVQIDGWPAEGQHPRCMWACTLA
ncbi:unnamed protein product [Symbiodinium necroappetens]|uniref:Uncharacterized protein n=1 Tax=Symbiodinium necroappetens TaxID=1628268 RepID=A0A813AN99_9DINO|nr:unnamed protein product [Symbiodinium necroappetens]